MTTQAKMGEGAISRARAAQLFAGLSLLLLSGCAHPTGGWRNPAVPESQWSSDYLKCRQQAEREAGITNRFNGTGPADDPMDMADREEAGKAFRAYAALCMVDKGYDKPKY